MQKLYLSNVGEANSLYYSYSSNELAYITELFNDLSNRKLSYINSNYTLQELDMGLFGAVTDTSVSYYSKNGSILPKKIVLPAKPISRLTCALRVRVLGTETTNWEYAIVPLKFRLLHETIVGKVNNITYVEAYLSLTASKESLSEVIHNLAIKMSNLPYLNLSDSNQLSSLKLATTNLIRKFNTDNPMRIQFNEGIV